MRIWDHFWYFCTLCKAKRWSWKNHQDIKISLHMADFFSFSKWRMALRSCGLNCQLPSCRLLPTGKAITARFLRTFFLLGGLPTPPFFRSESSLTSIRDIQRNMCAKEANKVENWDRKKNYTCATLSTNISNKDSAKLYKSVLLGGVLYKMRFLHCKT